jgi:hypothetical protein
MPWVGFEPTIPAFERVKTVHALDRTATVTARIHIAQPEFEQAVSGLNVRNFTAVLTRSGGRSVIIMVLVAVRIEIDSDSLSTILSLNF